MLKLKIQEVMAYIQVHVANEWQQDWNSWPFDADWNIPPKR